MCIRACNPKAEGECPGDPRPARGAARGGPAQGRKRQVFEDEEHGQDERGEPVSRGQIVRDGNDHEQCVEDRPGCVEMKLGERRRAAKPGLVLEPGIKKTTTSTTIRHGPGLAAGRSGVQDRAECGQESQHGEISDSFGEWAALRERLSEGGDLRDDRESKRQKRPEQGWPKSRAADRLPGLK